MVTEKTDLSGAIVFEPVMNFFRSSCLCGGTEAHGGTRAPSRVSLCVYVWVVEKKQAAGAFLLEFAGLGFRERENGGEDADGTHTNV
jgi:hypothetical protein